MHSFVFITQDFRPVVHLLLDYIVDSAWLPYGFKLVVYQPENRFHCELCLLCIAICVVLMYRKCSFQLFTSRTYTTVGNLKGLKRKVTKSLLTRIE